MILVERMQKVFGKKLNWIAEVSGGANSSNHPWVRACCSQACANFLSYAPNHNINVPPHTHNTPTHSAISEANIGTIEMRIQPVQQPDHSTITPRLPTPPKTTPTSHSLPPRPQTVADFRQRRYRKSSTERTFSQEPRASRGLDHKTASDDVS